jgi:hypothetical protein
MTNKTIPPPQVNQPKGSGSLEFDGLLAAFHAIVWATAEDDDPDLAYDEAGNVEAKKLQAMYRALQAELTKARELLADVAKTPWMYDVLGSVREYVANQSAPAAKDDDWHMNPCKQGHRDVGAAGGVAHCYTCDEKIEAATTQEAFERWNAKHPAEQPAPVAVVLPSPIDPDSGVKEHWYCMGWNSCLDEVIRLNGLKP